VRGTTLYSGEFERSRAMSGSHLWRGLQVQAVGFEYDGAAMALQRLATNGWQLDRPAPAHVNPTSASADRLGPAPHRNNMLNGQAGDQRCGARMHAAVRGGGALG
jgi:hypothetical protein